MSRNAFAIQAVHLQDVPTLAHLSAEAFEADRHTEMKGLGKEPFDMGKYSLESIPLLLKNPRCVILKAVDNVSGETMGYCNWGFRGFGPEEMPNVEGHVQPGPETENKDIQDRDSEKSKAKPADTDPVKRLEALTDADMQAWMSEVMPKGTRCAFVVTLSVSPRFQGQGVGSALLRWGIDFCNEKGVFAWVHSSEPAWRMYEKLGFQTIRSLDVDLDEYAPVPPPNEGPGARWGRYVFRYMKYLPRYT